MALLLDKLIYKCAMILKNVIIQTNLDNQNSNFFFSNRKKKKTKNITKNTNVCYNTFTKLILLNGLKNVVSKDRLFVFKQYPITNYF